MPFHLHSVSREWQACQDKRCTTHIQTQKSSGSFWLLLESGSHEHWTYINSLTPSTRFLLPSPLFHTCGSAGNLLKIILHIKPHFRSALQVSPPGTQPLLALLIDRIHTVGQSVLSDCNLQVRNYL